MGSHGMASWHVTTPRFSLAFSKQYMEGVENKEKSAKGLQNDAPQKKSHEMSPKLQRFRILVRRHNTETIKQYMQGARGSWPQRPSSQSGQIGSLSPAPSEEWPSLPVPNFPHQNQQRKHSQNQHSSNIHELSGCLSSMLLWLRSKWLHRTAWTSRFHSPCTSC